jgi:hypothetical protein
VRRNVRLQIRTYLFNALFYSKLCRIPQ